MGIEDAKFFETQRDRMIADQLMGRGISSAKVLQAMAAVPRERFVPAEQRGRAYEDSALAVGEGQTISQPYIVGLMSQLLELRPTDRVLEVGTGTGYQTAILATLAKEVFSIERIESLSSAARAILGGLKFANVYFHVGDGSVGWPEPCVAQSTPIPPAGAIRMIPTFDRIVITAGTPAIPGPLFEQLADGGILVAPRGEADHQRLVVIRREGETFSERENIPVRFVPLIGQYGWQDTH